MKIKQGQTIYIASPRWELPEPKWDVIVIRVLANNHPKVRVGYVPLFYGVDMLQDWISVFGAKDMYTSRRKAEARCKLENAMLKNYRRAYHANLR